MPRGEIKNQIFLQLIDIGDRPIGEAEQHLPRMRDNKDSLIFAVFVFGLIYGRRVDVAKVDLSTGILWDAGGEDDLHPIVFHAVAVRSDPLDVRGVGEDGAGDIFELLPLAKEVVARVVAHLADQFSVRNGDLGQVRSVDDHSSAV